MNNLQNLDPSALTPATTLEQAKRDLDEKGFCVLEDLLSPKQIERLQLRLAQQAAAERELGIGGADQAQLDASNQYVYALINKGCEFVELLQQPTILELVGHVLGNEFLLSATDGILAHPGGSLMPLHSDQWWMPQPTKRGEEAVKTGSITRFAQDPEQWPEYVAPAAVCNVMWMITPFSEENGATRVVPGTHLSGVRPAPDVPHKHASLAASGKAGTALVFDGRLWHATGANRTEESRLGIITAFCGPQFRPMENYVLGARQEVVDSASPELLRLLGFKVWNGYGKQDDPSESYVQRNKLSTSVLFPSEVNDE